MRRSTSSEQVDIMVLAGSRGAHQHIVGVEDDEESSGRVEAPN